MEESENRRDRLKAMRMQAAQAEVSNNVESSGVPGCLSNPLIETSVVQESCTPRFDFYTDPMSAFSDSRKRSNAANQIRPDYFKSPSSGGSLMSRFSPSHPGSLFLYSSFYSHACLSHNFIFLIYEIVILR
jgi:hypothetical protein